MVNQRTNFSTHSNNLRFVIDMRQLQHLCQNTLSCHEYQNFEITLITKEWESQSTFLYSLICTLLHFKDDLYNNNRCLYFNTLTPNKPYPYLIRVGLTPDELNTLREKGLSKYL